MQKNDCSQGEEISVFTLIFIIIEMKITRFVVGIFQTNSYLLEIENQCLLIDPASKAEKMIEELGEKELLGVLITHGHLDHIKAVDGLYKKYQMPIYIGEDDIALAADKNQGRKFGLSSSAYISSPMIPVKEQRYQIGPFEFEVMFTPGHTKGGVCYKFENALFTGDTLFHMACGRTDLDSGNESQLRQSLKEITSLQKNYDIYPGHEEVTNLDFEKENNPYL